MEEKNKNSTCLCGGDEHIVLACSGACDLGRVTDLVARKLRDNKVRNMSCLAAVGANQKSTIDSLKCANILLLDGCPIDCGKKILENANIEGYNYVRMTDYGYKKGATPVNEELINTVYQNVKGIN